MFGHSKVVLTATRYSTDLCSNERKVVVENGVQARYASMGHLVFGRDGRLFAVGFDAERAEATGEPVPVHDGVAMGTGSRADFALPPGDNGTLHFAAPKI